MGHGRAEPAGDPKRLVGNAVSSSSVGALLGIRVARMQAHFFKLAFPGNLVVSLPCPTHEVGRGSELLHGLGNWIRRCPRVRSAGEVSVLHLSPLPPQSLERNGRHGELETSVRWLPRASSAAAVELDMGQRLGAKAAGLKGEWNKVGEHSVFTLDSAKQGWCPGDELVYLLVGGSGTGALLFQPTHWLRYEWNDLEVAGP